jgi:Rhodopirellula transposase DDE domain
MNREVHVRFWERAGVKFPRATRQHRLFSFITINWRGRPLRSYRTIVQLIAATTTDTGLKVRAELDENKYPKGLAQLPPSVSPATRSTAIGITRFHHAEKLRAEKQLTELFMDGPLVYRERGF